MTLYPYWYRDICWVFDDPATGLKEEAFVLGASEMISRLIQTKGIPNASRGFALSFSDEPFDHECIRHFENGEDSRLAAFLTAALPRTGNGAHEIRDWVVAHAAAGSSGFELIDYFPSPETLVGVAFASWNVDGRRSDTSKPGRA